MFSPSRTFMINESQLRCIESKSVCLDTTHATKTFLDSSQNDLSRHNLWLYESTETLFLIENLFTTPNNQHETPLQGPQQIFSFLNNLFSWDLSPARPAEKQGLHPYATLQTFQRKYQFENVYIILLLVYAESFVHRQATIQVPTTSEEPLCGIYNTVLQNLFATTEMSREPFIPPLLSYLKAQAPQHYASLVAAKVIPEKYFHPKAETSLAASL